MLEMLFKYTVLELIYFQCKKIVVSNLVIAFRSYFVKKIFTGE